MHPPENKQPIDALLEMGAAARLGTRISLRIASRIFATIMPYTIEAADKVADAIERGERRRPSPSRSQSLVGGAVGISSVGAQYVQTGNYTLLAGFNRGAGWRSTCPAAPLCRRLAELFEYSRAPTSPLRGGIYRLRAPGGSGSRR